MATFTGTVLSNTLNMNTSLTVLTPKRFEGNLCELPVVYLLHGLSENNSDWHDKAPLTTLCDLYKIIFVLPQVERSFYTDMEFGLDYFTYITQELPLLCNKYFGLSLEPQKSYVFGMSMGGYGALKCALSLPERYAGCCAFSSVCDVAEWVNGFGKPYYKEYQAIWGMQLEHLAENCLYNISDKCVKAGIPKTKFYMTCGTEDFLYEGNVKLQKHLASLGLDFTYEEWSGAHEWRFWIKSLFKACEHLWGEIPPHKPLPVFQLNKS
ncbi:MAG: hypothetical protein IKV41_01605 [Oscillospiraceae bacterium]|nr:hypothetical protein [Oscillospiraceae bacterium]